MGQVGGGGVRLLKKASCQALRAGCGGCWMSDKRWD